MFHYKLEGIQCNICRQKGNETYHFDIYVWGSEGITICLPCILSLLENCEKDENLQARIEIGNVLSKMSYEHNSKKIKAVKERNSRND